MPTYSISFLSIGLLILTTSCGQTKDQQPAQLMSNQVFTNELIHETSPYLLEHAHNPVQWYPWGEKALEKAKKENKPLLISVGYSACHWCHVMAKETFSDTAVANYMNAHFICIKVDREERPDIDQIYMNAVQLITGEGGWPLNAFALSDGRPFYAGTYFGKQQWLDLLGQIVKSYQTTYPKLLSQAESLTQNIQSPAFKVLLSDSSHAFLEKTYLELFPNWKSTIDTELGGFIGSPKFPLPVGWELLLQNSVLTNNELAQKAVTTTLDKMALGGIYDHIGGGFARYSTDKNWKVPHFEKMLYDNAQLVSLYSHGYQLTHKQSYATLIRQTLQFVKSELTTAEGAFYSSLNADSEGEEGKFYVWSEKEFKQTLGKDTSALLASYFQVSSNGNWESNRNILYCLESADAFAHRKGIPEQAFLQTLEKASGELLRVRNTRIRPSLDDKILTGWNALMLKGYVDGYRALGEPEYLDAALKSARFLKQKMLLPSGMLMRNYKDGRASIHAFLDDYAMLADAYIELYQITFDLQWLTIANKLTEEAILHFKDSKSGLFFYTSDQSKDLVARKMEVEDNVIPSSNSVMGHNLWRLGGYYDNANYTAMAKTMLQSVCSSIAKGGPYYANWARLLGIVGFGTVDVAIVGKEAVDIGKQMQRSYLPLALFAGGAEENLPLLENKASAAKTLIYVCRSRNCKMPTDNVKVALKTIQGK